MKQTVTVILGLLVSTCIAQAPEKMSYQAVVRDASDMLLVNATIGMRVSVLQGSSTGTPVYVETHTSQTNDNGLVSIQIGDGSVVSGTVAGIDWANGPYFISSETDPSGGTNYSISGTTELLSVPYALHAANSGVGPQGPPGIQGPPGSSGCEIVRSGNMVVVYTSSNAYALFQGQSSGSFNNAQWTSVSLNGTVIGAEASENTIVIYTTTNAYGVYQTQSSGSLNSAQWSNTSLSGNVLGAVSNKNQVVVYSDSNAYGFFQGESSGGLNSAQWTSTSISGSFIGATASRHQCVVFTSSNAYALFQGQSSGNFNNAQWTSTSLNGTVQDAIPLR